VKKTTIQLVDDLTGEVIESGGGRSVTFSLEGKSYEIDLNNAGISRLQSALAPFISAARVTASSGRRSGGGSGARSNSAELQAIRQWARSHGHAVSDRGRISASIREAYAKAH
jgi:hypothetical protein